MEKKLVKENVVIPCYDTDASWRLKPVSFMNYAQEAANSHATILGFGYDDLISSHTAWVLSRMYVEFVKTPQWRDVVSFHTWHKGLDRLFYLRDFLMTDAAGNAIVKATSSWIVLDLDTRRLVRDPDLMDEGTTCKEDVISTPADKVICPRDLEKKLISGHIVSYSDVDMLGHTNNAMYMQWAMDAVDYEIASSRRVKNFTINFNHETKAGQKIEIYQAQIDKQDGLHVFIEGRSGDANSFSVEIVFE